MYLLITTGGDVFEIKPEKKELTLEEMYVHIGCSIVERVHLARGAMLWCDEEGLLKGRWETNDIATELMRKAYPYADPKDIGLVGNVILEDNTVGQDYAKKIKK